MIRKILCQQCGAPKPMHPEDVAMGFKERRKVFNVAKPKEHFITVNGVRQPDMESLYCDDCGAAIADGSEAVATTMWDANREGEPILWEREYLTLTPNAYDKPQP